VAPIGARDVIEAMLAVQMVTVHEAAMECFRRAALAEQTFAGRERGLKYGDRLVRSFAALIDALNRHRGKGQQVVRVEHVTVEAGGAGHRRRRHPGRGRAAQGSEDRAHVEHLCSRIFWNSKRSYSMRRYWWTILYQLLQLHCHGALRHPRRRLQLRDLRPRGCRPDTTRQYHVQPDLGPMLREVYLQRVPNVGREAKRCWHTTTLEEKVARSGPAMMA
jgi:hypothetical protein